MRRKAKSQGIKGVYYKPVRIGRSEDIPHVKQCCQRVFFGSRTVDGPDKYFFTEKRITMKIIRQFFE